MARGQTPSATAESGNNQADSEDCTGKYHNYGGSSPVITVAEGEQMTVDFWSGGNGAETYTILTDGTWTTRDGFHVGATWLYPKGCPVDTVQTAIDQHAADRDNNKDVNSNGQVVKPEIGFTN